MAGARHGKETSDVRFSVVIPARYASTRLPGKPVLEKARSITGKYIVQHVYDRAAAARGVEQVIVATDDRRIAYAVTAFGGEVRMTRPDHASGTDRIAEVAASMDVDVVVNVQGDEPGVRPEHVEQVVGLLAEDDSATMGTLAHPITTHEEWVDPNVVKVVVSTEGAAMYFTRSPVPFFRGATRLPATPPVQPLRHLGIYSYRRDFLLCYGSLPHSALEDAEKLEQLRALEAGYRIKVGVTPYDSTGIDTPADLEAWLTAWEAAPSASLECSDGEKGGQHST
jgi:3-deoxy-manno-octulosonate cytidylyltransferase (CMP-KDO synthetase)